MKDAPHYLRVDAPENYKSSMDILTQGGVAGGNFAEDLIENVLSGAKDLFYKKQGRRLWEVEEGDEVEV
jgi:hypothetical protein